MKKGWGLMSERFQGLSFPEAKKALLANFTGSSRHWGCYGTSMAIYRSLLGRNYYVEVIGVINFYRLSCFRFSFVLECLTFETLPISAR